MKPNRLQDVRRLKSSRGLELDTAAALTPIHRKRQRVDLQLSDTETEHARTAPVNQAHLIHDPRAALGEQAFSFNLQGLNPKSIKLISQSNNPPRNSSLSCCPTTNLRVDTEIRGQM